MDNPIGSIIRQKRKNLHLTLKDLSKLANIDYSMISKYEKGTVTPPEDKAQAILATLNSIEVRSNSSLPTLSGTKESIESWKHLNNIYPSLEADMLVHGYYSFIHQMVLEEADGVCELCGGKFEPDILKTHYVIWLIDGGEQETDNLVALCPTCHIMVHRSPNDPEITEKLLKTASTHKLPTIYEKSFTASADCFLFTNRDKKPNKYSIEG